MLRYYVTTETICGLIAAIPFFLLLEILYRKTTRPMLHRLGTYFYAGYLLAIFAVTGIPSLYRLRFHPRIGLIPFDGFESAPRQFFLNLLLFVPVGFLLPLLWRHYRSFIKTIAVGLFLSLFIEVMQIFSYRTTDIDDLIMNTLGTVVGWIGFALFYYMFPKVTARFQVALSDKTDEKEDVDGRHKEDINEVNRALLYYEPLFFVGVCWLTEFLLQPFVSNLLHPVFYV